MSADVVERVRMAVAEAGYDPALVVHRPGRITIDDDAVPLDVCWRAYELAECGVPTCLACSTHDYGHGLYAERRCLADRRFMEDCGVERPT